MGSSIAGSGIGAWGFGLQGPFIKSCDRTLSHVCNADVACCLLVVSVGPPLRAVVPTPLRSSILSANPEILNLKTQNPNHT